MMMPVACVTDTMMAPVACVTDTYPRDEDSLVGVLVPGEVLHTALDGHAQLLTWPLHHRHLLEGDKHEV